MEYPLLKLLQQIFKDEHIAEWAHELRYDKRNLLLWREGKALIPPEALEACFGKTTPLEEEIVESILLIQDMLLSDALPGNLFIIHRETFRALQEITVGDYLLRKKLQLLLRSLRRLPPEEQKERLCSCMGIVSSGRI